MQFDMRFGNTGEVFPGLGVLTLSFSNLTVVRVSFISNQKSWKIAEYPGIMKKELPRE
jgi:hypothetical protein